MTEEYVELVEEIAEAEEKQAAKVSRETGNIDQRVTLEDSDDAPNSSDSEDSDPDFNVDPEEASQVSRNLDFSAASSSGSRTRRSNTLIDPCIAEHPLADEHSTVMTRSSRPRQDKCDKCDQILPQFKKYIQTQTPGVNAWDKDKDVSSDNFSPWPQLSLRYPKTRQRHKEAKTFVPEVIETIVDIHTGNSVGIKSAIDIFRKVSRLFGQVYHLPRELRLVKGLQLDPLKKRKKKASYSAARKKFRAKKFRSQVVLPDTESEGENDGIEE